MTFTTEGMVGVSLQLRTELPTHDPGTTIKGRDNTIWIYGQASGAVTIGTCTVDASFELLA